MFLLFNPWARGENHSTGKHGGCHRLPCKPPSLVCVGGQGTYLAKIINVLARIRWGRSAGRDCPSLLGAALPWQALSRGMGSLVTLSPFYSGERMRFVSEQKETSLFPPLDGAGGGFWRWGGCLCHAPSHLRCGAGWGWGTRGCPPAPRWLWVPSGMCSQLERGRCDLPLSKRLAP